MQHVSPSTVCQVGLLSMTKEDVTWHMLVKKWINKKPDREAELLDLLCERYIRPTLEFLTASTSVPPKPGAALTRAKYKPLQHVVWTTEITMTETLIALFEVCFVCQPRLVAFIEACFVDRLHKLRMVTTLWPQTQVTQRLNELLYRLLLMSTISCQYHS